jgi:hypothetical protein
MLKKVVGVLALLGAGACGGGSSTPTTPTADRAVLELTYVTGSARVGLSADPRFAYALRVTVQIQEIAGLSVNADYVRLALWLGATEIERVELTATDIVAGVGTNTIAGGSTVRWTLTFRYNSTTADSAQFYFHFTDFKGNQYTPLMPPIIDFALSPVPLSQPGVVHLPTF